MLSLVKKKPLKRFKVETHAGLSHLISEHDYPDDVVRELSDLLGLIESALKRGGTTITIEITRQHIS